MGAALVQFFCAIIFRFSFCLLFFDRATLSERLGQAKKQKRLFRLIYPASRGFYLAWLLAFTNAAVRDKRRKR